MSKRIALILCPEYSMSEIASAKEVFSLANKIYQQVEKTEANYFDVEVINFTNTTVSSSIDTYEFDPCININADLYLISGCFAATTSNHAKKYLSKELLKACQENKIIVGLSAATFYLAEIGVLTGKRATTHWQYAKQFSQQFPEIQLSGDEIYTKDMNIYTSCGYSATYDLCIDLVESCLGRVIANQVSQFLVLYCRRPAEARQHSDTLQAQVLSEDEKFVNLLNYIEENIAERLQVATLASQVAMSERNFSRVFTRKFGITPYKYIEKIRAKKANLLMKSTDLSLKKIGILCGYRNKDHMRRAHIKFST